MKKLKRLFCCFITFILMISTTSILITGRSFARGANNSNINISDKIKAEIDKQLGGANSSIMDYKRNTNKLEKRVSSVVEKELNKQIYYTLHDHAKERVYGSHSDDSAMGDFVPFIYKVPDWPIQSLFFFKKDFLGIHFKGEWATKAYGSSGGSKDVSNLIFKQEPIFFKDIVMASKLLGIPGPPIALVLSPSKYKFLDILKDKCLVFDASTEREELAFSYIRHFLKGDVALGLQVPIVRKVHKVRLNSKLTSAERSNLETNSTNFFTLYPDGLIDLFEDTLSRKNISFNQRDTEVGLGDISAFFNYEIKSRHCERCLVGLKFLFPTSKSRDVYKLWDPELGNEGFTEISLFGSLLFGKSRFFNPHCFVQLTYAIPTRVPRRVPRLISDSDLTSDEKTLATVRFDEDFMIFGNGVKLQSLTTTFSEHDTIVRRFSDKTKKTKIHKAPNVFFRIGNMVENFLTERLFLDVFYDLFAKGRDYSGLIKPDDKYDPSILNHNSYEIAHRLGLNMSWQADDYWRLHLGGLYTFAGRNTLQSFEINAAITLEF